MRLYFRKLTNSPDNVIRFELMWPIDKTQHPGNTLGRVVSQELENTDIVTPPGRRTVTIFKLLADFTKDRRQLPVAINAAFIERRRSFLQRA